MKNKVWHKVEISTEEQEIEVYPTETFDGIIVETKELDGSGSPRLYLNKDEMEFLITKMQEMMKYVKQTKAPYFLMLTECGLVGRLQVEDPEKHFIGGCRLCRARASPRRDRSVSSSARDCRPRRPGVLGEEMLIVT